MSDTNQLPQAGNGAPYGSHQQQGGQVPHYRSQLWMSPQATVREVYQSKMHRLRCKFPRSEFVSWGLMEWLANHGEMIEAKSRRLDRQVTERMELKSLGLPRLKPAFDGKVFPENLSAVLAKPTIWCQSWKVPWRDNAPWPFIREMKWEGDDRAATKYGRFLALPREPSTEINFNNIPMIKAFEFDEVRRVPTLEDTHLPVDEIEDVDIPNPYLKDLVEEIDNIDIY